MNESLNKWRNLNVILSHDWLTGMRGGERVLEILCRAFPKAPLFTLVHDPSSVSEVINAHQIKTSWLQSLPGIINHYRYFLPLFPSAIELMHPPEADILISTSHCIAKGLRPRPGTKHICYCLTPMRYAWTFYKEYFGESPINAIFAKPMLLALRAWDRKASTRVDRFVAISRHVQKRIKDFYGRESDIVYPPVDTVRLTPVGNGQAASTSSHLRQGYGGQAGEGNFDLIVSALVPYKRIDLAIGAYSRLGYPLKIVGVGNEMKKLRAISGPNIEFLGWQSDEKVLELYRACRFLIFPGEEDFGIVPLEAQACGRPVVAYGRGGALETVEEGVSGVFFDEQTEESLLAAVSKCASIRWDSSVIRANAEKFGIQNFLRGLSAIIAQCLLLA